MSILIPFMSPGRLLILYSYAWNDPTTNRELWTRDDLYVARASHSSVRHPNGIMQSGLLDSSSVLVCTRIRPVLLPSHSSFIAGLSYYTELLAMFPNRAGADVAYLEQAYNRPKFLCVYSQSVSKDILSQ